MSEHHSDATMTESTLPYVYLRSLLTVDSEMINELNAVLVPDEELVRIREFKTMLEEVQERRDAERSKFEEIIKRMFALNSTDGKNLKRPCRNCARVRRVPLLNGVPSRSMPPL